ncbi:MAG: HAD family hydrolase [Lachnospiraceae bacterium]|nr:HAD family hydrolase [Lachnospiraceae bacterium]
MNKNKYDLAVFDMDGTILYTLEDLKNSVNHTMRNLGFPERTLEEIKAFVGNGVPTLLKRSAPEGTSDEVLKKAYDIFAAHYKIHGADNTSPYEGIVDIIPRIKALGIKTAVVSNKADFAVQILCKQFFNGLFDVSIGDREGYKNKPAPDLVNLALKEAGVSKEHAVYIGDSDVDIQTAKNSDLPCISVTWGFRSPEFLKEHGATDFAHTPEDLLKFF